MFYPWWRAKELAKCFSVNTCSVYRLLKRRNETGSYETQTDLRGKKPKLSDADHQHILSLLEKQLDITCLETDLLPHLNGNSVLVMDHMKSHHAKAVKEFLDCFGWFRSCGDALSF